MKEVENILKLFPNPCLALRIAKTNQSNFFVPAGEGAKLYYKYFKCLEC